jgi:hypothetical protein
MSSPKLAKSVSAKAPVAKVSRGFDKVASDAGMSKNDKANFIKAMMEGVPAKGAPKSAAKNKAVAAPAAKAAKATKSKAARSKADAPQAERPHVEILRKIPAPVRHVTPSNPQSDEARKFAAMLEKKLAAGDLGVLTPEAIQALMQALCKLYSANMDSGNKFPVVDHRMAISGTDAMIMCGALLKAVDLQVFELGMWQSWSGI